MSSTAFLQNLVNGIGLGSIYALMALGFTMTYGVLKLINFAHGDVFMLGIYSVYGLLLLSHSLWGSVVAAVIIGFLVGLGVERVGFRPLRGSSDMNLFISSLAISVTLENLVIMIIGPRPYAFKPQGFLTNRIMIGSVVIPNATILTIVVTVVLAVVLFYIVANTRFGIAMRATSDNLLACRLVGINVNWIIALTFAISGALAATGGVLWASKYTVFSPLVGFVPGLKSFVAAVVGGIGNLYGAILGGFLIGLCEILLLAFLPSSLSAYRDVFIFSLLVVILIFRPQGILGEK